MCVVCVYIYIPVCVCLVIDEQYNIYLEIPVLLVLVLFTYLPIPTKIFNFFELLIHISYISNSNTISLFFQNTKRKFDE